MIQLFSNTRHPVFLLMLLALFAGSSQPLAGEEIPPLARPDWPELSAYPTELPVWVSAAVAFDEAGRLGSGLFLPRAGARLQQLLERPRHPATGCTEMTWIEQEYVNPPDRSTLDRAIRSSELVLWGVVVAAAPGFERGDLGQMVQIRPIEGLRSRAGVRLLPYYYAFVPAGRLRFADFDVCKVDPRVVVPEVGEEVVVFAYRYSSDDAYLNLEYEGSLLAFDSEGNSRLPRILAAGFGKRELPARSALLAEIRGAVESAAP